MPCKYCEEFTGVCFNPESPMRGDTCPVPDTEGICRFEDREEEIYKLSPKGCAIVALMDAHLLNGRDDSRIEVFWDSFSMLMEKFGYAKEG